jgi:hypothetical protein
MFFMHIIDDYYLQCIGILSKLKQKNFWEENAPEPLYKYDYIVALFMHSLSWSFMIMLPIAFWHQFNVSGMFFIVLVINTILHAFIDDLKCNKKKINLITDQALHIIQIALTFGLLI